VSVLTENSGIQATLINSVATDRHAQTAVIKSMGFRGQSHAMTKAVGGNISQSASVDTFNTEDDPDFKGWVSITSKNPDCQHVLLLATCIQ
jgi:hypothetical protein